MRKIRQGFRKIKRNFKKKKTGFIFLYFKKRGKKKGKNGDLKKHHWAFLVPKPRRGRRCGVRCGLVEVQGDVVGRAVAFRVVQVLVLEP